jgi:hypothetical protein
MQSGFCSQRSSVHTHDCAHGSWFLHGNPVEVVEKINHHAVEEAVLRAIGRGNPTVPTPTRDAYPEPVVLKYAKVRSLSTFERLAQTWKFAKHGSTYEIVPYQRLKTGGGEEDRDRTEAIPADEQSLESAVHRLVERALVTGR